MANKKISELNQAITLQDSDLLAIVQAEGTEKETRKTTVGNLRSNVASLLKVSSPAGCAVEDFPMSMAEGGQSMAVGFYGVRFTPGQSFFVQKAQICKRDAMTSGTFVVAIYSAGTTENSARTEGMTLLTQSNTTSLAGNGIGTAEFAEAQQIQLSAEQEYYMVVYIQHPSNSSRGLICRKLNANSWGNSNLTLAFSGTSQTVLSTLGSSAFSTLYPASDVNEIILPYIKIFGSVAATVEQDSHVLVITDENASQYFISVSDTDPTDVHLVVPENYSIVVVETTAQYSVSKILPPDGVTFSDYKKIGVMGNVDFWAGSASSDSTVPSSGSYRISLYWYAQHSSSAMNESFAEFILKNNVWYSVFY